MDGFCMMNDLNEIKERMAFAKGEIETVTREVEKFEQESLVTSIRHLPEGCFEILAEQKKGIPTPIKSRAGTAVNEMRSCLDELAGHLARRNGATSTNDVYFPISKSEEIFEKDGLKAKIKKLSASDKSKISGIKPYKGGHNSLYSLHELDCKRKHDRLMTCSTKTGGVEFAALPNFFRGENVVLENCNIQGDYIEHLELKPVTIKQLQKPIVIMYGRGMQAPFRPVIHVAYREPEGVAGMRVVDILNVFHKDILDVIALFE